MLLGVTNKKQVLIDLGIDDICEADDAADDNIAGGETRGASHLCDIITLSVKCHVSQLVTKLSLRQICSNEGLV